MKTDRPAFPLPGTSARSALAIAIATMLPAFHAGAADIIKQNNTTALNLAASWDVQPTATDIAVWNNTVTAANNSALGGSVSWQGIRIANPGGAVIIGDTAGATLSLGSSGIDMSAATQNLTINANVSVTAPQTWTLAAGRTLNLWAVNTSRGLSGSSDIAINGPASGSATVVMLPGQNGSLGFNDLNGNSGFSGNWTIGPNVTAQMIRNGRTAWGSGTINLNGGTIAQIQGNWTWTNPIALSAGTTSTIANNATGSNRYLKLQSAISGSGNLNFADTTGAMGNNSLGFIVTGANTMSGTVTIPASRFVRVGGVGGDDTTTVAGTSGTLGTATVANNGTLTLSHSDTWTFGNDVSGTGALTIGHSGITGTATQDVTITGNNSYSGMTTIANGTVRIGAGGTSGSLGNGAVVNNGTLSFNRSDALTLANDISGIGTLSQDGTGTLTLSGALSYAGPTNVNAGKLVVNTTLAGDAIVAGGATLGGNGTITGAVTVNTGGALETGNVNIGKLTVGTLSFGTGTTSLRATASPGGAALIVSGADGMILNGTTTLNVGGIGLTAGSKYTLVDYAGTIGGNGFAGFTLGTLPARVLGNLVNNTANTSIDFHVSAFDKPKWTGTTDGIWSTTASNWKEITSGNATAYIEGDDVLFDDTATGTTNVSLNTTVSPAAVTVNNNTRSYSIGGTGKISGAAALTKSGNGTLTLANTGGNDYAGGTTINGGTLKLGATNALPTAGSVSISTSATLDLGGFAGQVGALTGTGRVINSGTSAAALTVANSENIEFGGTIIDGASPTALTKSGTGTLTLTGSNTYTGGTTISSGKLALGNGGASGSVAGAVTNNATLEINRSDVFTLTNAITGTGSLDHTGTGTTILTGANSYGATNIINGILQVGNGGTSGTLGTAGVNIGAGAFLAYNRSDATTLSSTLSGPGGFLKNGTGTLTVNGNNSFTGGATINAGTVVYGHANALGNSGTLSAGFTLRGGTVDFNGQSNYNPGPNHFSGSLPSAVLLVQNQTITLGGAAGTTTLKDSGDLGFGSFFAVPAGSVSTSIYFDAMENPGTATIAAKFLSTGTSGTFTRAIVVDDSTATTTEVDITGQMGAAPDAIGGFGDGKNTTIQKSGEGTLRISAANYFPILQVSAGKLVVNHALALGQSKTDVPTARGGAGSANLLVVDGGTVDLNGFSPSVGGLSDNTLPGGIVTNDGSVASTLTVGSSDASTVFSGTLKNGASPLGLTKVGTGTLSLWGVNTYTGDTTINAGTLLVSGTLSGSRVTVNGGTLGGNAGTVGPATVNASGNFAPGEVGIGTLNVAGSLDLLGSATFEIDKTGFTLASDLANATGVITLGGTLNVVATGESLVPGDKFNLFDAPGFTGSFTALNLPALSNPAYSWDTTKLAVDGTLAVVPEPGAAVSVIAGLALLLGLRRRRAAIAGV
ncbi:beta strand repeat-containing protein [Verrucomicrobiota bacterium sgz303538]